MSTLSFGDRVIGMAWRLAPQRFFSDFVGGVARVPIPSWGRARVLTSFAARYGIDVGEAEKAVGNYTGLQEFFTRRLKPGARPIDRSPGVVVSAADGTVVETGQVSAGRLIAAKESLFTVKDLLADPAAASALEGGEYIITYLSPKDYHRVHSPVAGNVLRWHHIPGWLFSVNEKSVVREPGLFGKNERFVSIIASELGLCAVVMVAAVGVGHMTASYDSEVATHTENFSDGSIRHKIFETPVRLERGGELGIFHLGSTAITIFEPGRVALAGLQPGSSVRMGAAIGRALPVPL